MASQILIAPIVHAFELKTEAVKCTTACRPLGSPVREEVIKRNENERGIPAIDETLEIVAYA